MNPCYEICIISYQVNLSSEVSAMFSSLMPSLNSRSLPFVVFLGGFPSRCQNLSSGAIRPGGLLFPLLTTSHHFSPLFTTFSNFWPLFPIFSHFSLLFLTFHYFFQICVTFSHFSQLLATFSHFSPLFTAFLYFSLLFPIFVPLFTTFSNFWQLFPTFSHFSPLFPTRVQCTMSVHTSYHHAMNVVWRRRHQTYPYPRFDGVMKAHS